MAQLLACTYFRVISFPPSEQELLALGDRIGSVSTALSEEQFVKCLRRSIYITVATKANAQVVDDIKCSICQVSCHHLSIKCCVAPFLGSLLLLMHSERLKVKLKTESTLPLSYILMKWTVTSLLPIYWTLFMIDFASSLLLADDSF